MDGFEIPLIYRPISWFSGTTGDRREELRQALGGKGGFFGELLTNAVMNSTAVRKGSLGNDPFIERWFALAELVDLTDNPKPGAKPDSNQFPEGRQTNFTVVLVPAVTARATPEADTRIILTDSAGRPTTISEANCPVGRDVNSGPALLPP